MHKCTNMSKAQNNFILYVYYIEIFTDFTVALINIREIKIREFGIIVCVLILHSKSAYVKFLYTNFHF